MIIDRCDERLNWNINRRQQMFSCFQKNNYFQIKIPPIISWSDVWLEERMEQTAERNICVIDWLMLLSSLWKGFFIESFIDLIEYDEREVERCCVLRYVVRFEGFEKLTVYIVDRICRKSVFMLINNAFSVLNYIILLNIGPLLHWEF